ncbi:MAG: ATP-dependent Clp protease adaptor ClpS [Cyclobacteriaceae bacterium]
MDYGIQEDVLIETAVQEELLELRDLVVINDDYNTFDHVINTLIRVCKHTPEQAEQCTLIIHYKGKCAVKKGTFEELKPMLDAIHDVGIGAEIQ